jgi:hypothetical protein
MVIRRISILLGCILMAVASSAAFASDIPGPLKSRFVTGDPVWRELPVRDDLRSQYDKCWQMALGTILENNFDIATMERDSGYARTTWNTGVVSLGGDWNYRVQISIKFVFASPEPGAPAGAPPQVEKIRVQAAGEISDVNRVGRVKHYFRGYDSVVLQNLFQDLQAKLGSR